MGAQVGELITPLWTNGCKISLESFNPDAFDPYDYIEAIGHTYKSTVKRLARAIIASDCFDRNSFEPNAVYINTVEFIQYNDRTILLKELDRKDNIYSQKELGEFFDDLYVYSNKKLLRFLKEYRRKQTYLFKNDQWIQKKNRLEDNKMTLTKKIDDLKKDLLGTVEERKKTVAALVKMER